MSKGTAERFKKRADIPDLKKLKQSPDVQIPTRNTLFKFINSHNVRLAVEPEPSNLKNCMMPPAEVPMLAQEIEYTSPQ